MKMNLKKGFTLIELLVVVAIIGILASVVLASLNTARTKGSDAAVKAQLAGLRAEAEIYYDGTGATSYGNLYAAGQCSSAAAGVMFKDDPSFATAITNLGTTTGGAANVVCAAGANLTGATKASSWAMSATLKGTVATWCVDSTGASKGASVASGGGAATTPAVCS